MSSETTEEIIRATGRALCAHGYAGLTMQRIAEESSLSTAAIHYHFDTKEELLGASLDALIEQFEAELACEASDPRERLSAVLDAVFTPSEPSAEAFPVALMELKAQARYHEAYRDRFRELDETVRTVVASAVRDGIDSGVFDDCDPEAVARFVATVSNGSHVRTVALDEEASETRRLLERYLAEQLGWMPDQQQVVP